MEGFGRIAETDASTSATRSCTKCQKTESEDLKLKVCAKCKKAPYCTKECQKSDWKNHKKTCGNGARGTTSANEPGNINASSFKKVSREGNTITGFNCFELGSSKMTPGSLNLDAAGGSWLHDMPEEQAFKMLIDSYRMRVEDEYVFCGDIDEDSLYSGNGSGQKGFSRYLDKIERKNPELLPPWWNQQKRAACMKYALNKKNWSSIHYAVEKSDIKEHYGNPLMPMQLRMFSETVLGPLY